MSNTKFKLNYQGVGELLKSPQMQTVLQQVASAKASQAGEGYASSVHIAPTRAAANIYPNSAEAAQDNYENNTLLKVIGG